MKTILVPTDYSENAWYATEYAARIAQQTKARIVLFHAIELPLIASEVSADLHSLNELNQHHTARLQEMVSQLTRKYGVETTYKLKAGVITEVLKPVFDEEKADLVVMGLRGTNPVGRLLMGGVTASVLKRSQLPVLIIPRDFSFRGIRHILFACDYEPVSSSSVLHPLQDIAKTFDATVEVMHLPQPLAAGKRAEAPIDERYWEKQLHDVRVGYTFLYEEDIQKGIDQGVCESHADMNF
jgi:nucleotide-binding universal stress UspA family protein